MFYGKATLTVFVLVFSHQLAHAKCDTLLLERIGKRSVVTVFVSSHYLRLLVDPGQPTQLLEHARKLLNIVDSQIQDKIRIGPTGRFETGRWATIPMIQIGGSKITSVEALITPLQSLDKLHTLGVDGVLGSNLFVQKTWQLDFNKNQLIFCDQLSGIELSKQTLTYKVSVERKYKSISIPIGFTLSAMGARPVEYANIKIDLYNDASLMINPALSADLNSEYVNSTFGWIACQYYAQNLEIDYRLIEAKIVNMGTITPKYVGSLPITVSPDAEPSIGLSFLSNYKITFDIERNKSLYLDPTTNTPNSKLRGGTWGVDVWNDWKRCYIRRRILNSSDKPTAVTLKLFIVAYDGIQLSQFANVYAAMQALLNRMEDVNTPLVLTIESADGQLLQETFTYKAF